MKRLIYMAVGIIAAGMALGFYGSRFRGTPDSSGASASEPLPAQAEERRRDETSLPGLSQTGSLRVEAAKNGAPNSTASTATSSAKPSNVFNQAIDTLISPQATFDEKQTAWHQFENTDSLAHAIAELEARTKSDPTAAGPHAALGMAYLRKCGMIQDVREQGILAMTADKSFDTALELDPANWDARFTKALAMSMWPPQLNKGPEVIEHFRVLIEQQEAQAAQPHFAVSYLKLGEQYQKAGYSEYARQTFERGAGLFPENKELQARIKEATKQ